MDQKPPIPRAVFTDEPVKKTARRRFTAYSDLNLGCRLIWDAPRKTAAVNDGAQATGELHMLLTTPKPIHMPGMALGDLDQEGSHDYYNKPADNFDWSGFSVRPQFQFKPSDYSHDG